MSSNRYMQIIEHIFFSHYTEGAREIEFERREFEEAAKTLGIPLPKNLGDIIYSFRYRSSLPETMRAKAPEGQTWVIRPAGRGRYRIVAVAPLEIKPNPGMTETKIPDATPGIIDMYASDDEQALLAKLRYNRLIDIFTGVTCYSLQSHLRTTLPDGSQIETDEIYVGVDRRGVQYVFPVQAKAANETLGQVQIEQDFELCAHRFPSLTCRAIAAQFMERNLIALFELEQSESGVAIAKEMHYRLVPPDDISPDDLQAYGRRTS